MAAQRRTLQRIFGAPRVVFTACASLAVGLLLAPGWATGLIGLMVRAVGIGLVALVGFGVVEQWPRRLPRWLARWVLQVVVVAFAIPLATFTIYVASTGPDQPPFWHVADRLEGFSYLTFLGVLIAPWAALAALVRQKDALARNQALEFDLERSELERQALEARLRLLQAQVAPHFLFNSLANVQALVDAGSAKASPVLRSLTAYLRAAVPRLHEQATTIGEEVDLVRAYLELMHMRMPDRLQFALTIDDAACSLRCPPITLLTLVENAVRHGIDPSEDGGRIDVDVERRADRCLVRVSDTGVGLRATTGGLGTGLSTLRERLKLAFDDDAQLHLTERTPHGVCARLDLPARGVT